MPDGYLPHSDTLSAVLMPKPSCNAYDGTHTTESRELDTIMIETLLRNIDARLNQMDKRFDRIDDRFDKVDERFDKIDERFDKVDERFIKVDERFEKIDLRFREVHDRFTSVEVTLAAIGTEVKGLNGRLGRVESTVDQLNEAVTRVGERVAYAQGQLLILGELRVETAELTKRVNDIAVRVHSIPTWRGLGTGAIATVAASATSVTWLVQGGAKAMARWFE